MLTKRQHGNNITMYVNVALLLRGNVVLNLCQNLYARRLNIYNFIQSVDKIKVFLRKFISFHTKCSKWRTHLYIFQTKTISDIQSKNSEFKQTFDIQIRKQAALLP